MDRTLVVGVKKLGVLLAALAAVLIAAFLIAAPAGAQAEGGDVDVQYVDCSQVQNAAAEQGQYGVAVGDGATADLAQELNISQEQVNACLGNIGNNDDDRNNNDDDNNNDEGDDVIVAEDDDDVVEEEVVKSTIPDDEKVLAATGGMSLPGTALLAFALVGTGLLVLRFAVRLDR